jgi:alkanesulfonate monooxygenase SsuD/methylene tetrahydromethanopterin reductase-like flavin-dependent oxidoreductase (luciferase family)
VKIGMTLPSMVREYERDTTLRWCRGIDEGPFSSLACGERITFHNQEMRVLLSAAAALTERVRIVPTLYVLPMHSAAFSAKELATLDVLSGGRVTLVVGVGGREQDYRAVGAPFERRFAKLDAQVAELRRLWSGEPAFEGVPPVGPAPVQPGGPPIWAGAMGPKSLRRAARWADGVDGFSMSGDAAEVARGFAAADAAWQEAGRPARPYRATGFWYALGDGAKDRLQRYVFDYLRVFGERYVFDYLRVFGDAAASGLAAAARIDSVEAFRDAVAAIREAGADELLLVPTSSDPRELDRTQEALA